MSSGGPDQALGAFALRDDGSLTAPVASATQSGSGPDTDPQERSHPHCVMELSDNLLLMTDLGAGTLTLYRAVESRFERVTERRTRPGQGPRHAVRDTSGRFVFVINELDSTIVGYRSNETEHALEEIAIHSPRPDCGEITNYAADIQISAMAAFCTAGTEDTTASQFSRLIRLPVN